MITSTAGTSAKETIYKPFGEAIDWTTDANEPLETKGFIGERFDADAGLQFLNARYYDPKLALFIQPDWFEVTKAGVGTNRYSYSFNDPVDLMDPEGNCIDCDIEEEWDNHYDDKFERSKDKILKHESKGKEKELEEEIVRLRTYLDFRIMALEQREFWQGSCECAASGDFIFEIAMGLGSLASKSKIKLSTKLVNSLGKRKLGTLSSEPLAQKLLEQARHNPRIAEITYQRHPDLAKAARKSFKKFVDHMNRLEEFIENPTTLESMAGMSDRDIRNQQLVRAGSLHNDNISRNLSQALERMIRQLDQ